MSTFSFWDKVSARDLKPKACPHCGQDVVAKVWPIVLVTVLFAVLLVLGIRYSVLWKSPWPPVAVLLAMGAAFLSVVHWGGLTQSTPRRSKIASRVYATLWVCSGLYVGVLVIYQIARYVRAP